MRDGGRHEPSGHRAKTMRAATGAAPGKVILFGEHAVVYGRPAVAAALGHGLGAIAEPTDDGPTLHIPAWGPKGLHVRLEGADGLDAIGRAFVAALDAAEVGRPKVAVTIDGALPLGVGLGSSAAFAVSMLRALGEFRGAPFEREALLQAAASVETVFHGNPSGIDHTVIADGGCLRFQRGSEPAFRAVRLAREVPLVVAWTPREGTTREVVAGLRRRRDEMTDLYEDLFDAMGAVANAGIAALESGDLDALGQLFDLAHGYLNACGVSRVANERMVACAREAGALGAKLTGAGAGGAVVAAAPRRAHESGAALVSEGFQAFATQLPASGG